MFCDYRCNGITLFSMIIYYVRDILNVCSILRQWNRAEKQQLPISQGNTLHLLLHVNEADFLWHFWKCLFQCNKCSLRECETSFMKRKSFFQPQCVDTILCSLQSLLCFVLHQNSLFFLRRTQMLVLNSFTLPTFVGYFMCWKCHSFYCLFYCFLLCLLLLFMFQLCAYMILLSAESLVLLQQSHFTMRMYALMLSCSKLSESGSVHVAFAWLFVTNPASFMRMYSCPDG